MTWWLSHISTIAKSFIQVSSKSDLNRFRSVSTLTFTLMTLQEAIRLFPSLREGLCNVMVLHMMCPQTFPLATVICENYGVLSGAMGITGITGFFF